MKRSMFPENGIWLKGNTHCHSTVSDGRFSPDEIAAYYHERGYDFFAFTDHNQYVPHDAELGKYGMISLTGVERAINYRPVNKGTDIVGIGLKDTCGEYKAGAYGTNKGNYSCNEIHIQTLIDKMRADGQYVVIAHPRGSRLTADDCFLMQNAHALEVYNSCCEYGGADSGYGDSEHLWDILLQRGKHLFCIAADDTHGRLCRLYACGGWIVVKAQEKSKEAIFQAMCSGHFYASRGPQFFDYGIEDGEVYVKCSPCRCIHFSAYPHCGASCFNEEDTPVTEGRFKLKGNETYIRVTLEDDRGMRAWSQPIWFDHDKEGSLL